MGMFRAYSYFILAAVILILGLGIIAPALVSAKNDIAVMFGWGVAIITPTLVTGVYLLWVAEESDIRDYNARQYDFWKDRN